MVVPVIIPIPEYHTNSSNRYSDIVDPFKQTTNEGSIVLPSMKCEVKYANGTIGRGMVLGIIGSDICVLEDKGRIIRTPYETVTVFMKKENEIGEEESDEMD